MGLGWRLVFGLGWGLLGGLILGLVFALGYGLLEIRSVPITSGTPKEARSRSLTAALTWLGSGLIGGLIGGLLYRPLFEALFEALVWGLVLGLIGGLLGWLVLGPVEGLVMGLVGGLLLALRNGGWFVLLQKVAHRRLAQAGNLPPRPYDFLEWGIERQIFRRVGGGVRFRHNLIQRHLASTSKGAE